MIFIGCDYHPSWQQVCWLDVATGETGKQPLVHASGDAEKFYRRFAAPVRVGITPNANSFVERLRADQLEYNRDERLLNFQSLRRNTTNSVRLAE